MFCHDRSNIVLIVGVKIFEDNVILLFHIITFATLEIVLLLLFFELNKKKKIHSGSFKSASRFSRWFIHICRYKHFLMLHLPVMVYLLLWCVLYYNHNTIQECSRVPHVGAVTQLLYKYPQCMWLLDVLSKMCLYQCMIILYNHFLNDEIQVWQSDETSNP